MPCMPCAERAGCIEAQMVSMSCDVNRWPSSRASLAICFLLARPALEADVDTAQQSNLNNLDSEPGADRVPSSHLWPPVPQEGAVPDDALDAFVPSTAGGGRSGASASASAADEVFCRGV